MLIHPWDEAPRDEALEFVRATGFGHLVASGRGREVPVVVPNQFSLSEETVLLHLARPNPVWEAVEENPAVLLVVTGDWTYVPGAWKQIPELGEDPALGVPTTYYSSVHLTCRASIVDDLEGKADVLRTQLADLEDGLADPAVHARKLPGIRGLRLEITEVRGKFKYGGNLDQRHRDHIAGRLLARGAPGDAAAAARATGHTRKSPGQP